jgi:hypothetical protein
LLRSGNIKSTISFSLGHQPQTKHPRFKADPPNKYLRRRALEPATAVPSRLRILLQLTANSNIQTSTYGGIANCSLHVQQVIDKGSRTRPGVGPGGGELCGSEPWSNNEHGKWLQWGRDVRYSFRGCQEAEEHEVQSLSSATSNSFQQPKNLWSHVPSFSNSSAASVITSAFKRRLSARTSASFYLASRCTEILHRASAAIQQPPQEALRGITATSSE